MRLALVHDYLTQYGGAERVLQRISDIFPDAPIFTLLYDEKATGGAFKGRKIITSSLQKISIARNNHRLFPLFMPFFIEQFDLSQYDVILSDSSGYAKGVLSGVDAVHIDYCHTPLRYAWDDSHKYIREFPYSAFIKKFIPFLITYLRIWDRQASGRVDIFLANSSFVSRRIEKYYHRKSSVIFPPVDTGFFDIKNDKREYYLGAGRMVPYKKFDLLVDAFNKNGLPLKLVGDGPQRSELQKKAKKNIEFMGLVNDADMPRIYSGAKAFLLPQKEDFGIVAVESLSCGTPVIAYKGGGVLEIVSDHENGLFFEEQTADCLNEALSKFNALSFDAQEIRKSAAKFDKKIFQEKIKKIVYDAYRRGY